MQIAPSLRFLSRAALVACLVGGPVGSLAAQVVTLSDTEFAPADWTMTLIETAVGGGSGSAGQLAAGGNPGAFRQVLQTVNAGAGSLVGHLHVFGGATYDPGTSGAVLSLDFQVDTRQYNPPFVGSQGQSLRAAVVQNGVAYLSGYAISPETAWTTKSMLGLTASSFVEHLGTAHPDFGATGASFEVGFFTLNSTGGGGYTTEVGYDNFSFALSVAAAVPYCTAGTSASGCQAILGATGTPSASAGSGFVLAASGVEGAKDGLFYYGTSGRQASPWGNGTSFQCVVPPVQRGGLLTGSGTPGACDGALSQDLNALWAASPAKNPGAGALVQAQLWYRDPQNTGNQTTSLSDAAEFTVLP